MDNEKIKAALEQAKSAIEDALVECSGDSNYDESPPGDETDSADSSSRPGMLNDSKKKALLIIAAKNKGK